MTDAEMETRAEDVGRRFREMVDLSRANLIEIMETKSLIDKVYPPSKAQEITQTGQQVLKELLERNPFIMSRLYTDL